MATKAVAGVKHPQSEAISPNASTHPLVWVPPTLPWSIVFSTPVWARGKTKLIWPFMHTQVATTNLVLVPLGTVKPAKKGAPVAYVAGCAIRAGPTMNMARKENARNVPTRNPTGTCWRVERCLCF